jgi:hypothetical protein
MGMTMRATTNIDKVFADMDNFVDQARNVAIPRALNKLRDQAETAGLRAINDIYAIGPRTMEKYVTLTLASRGNLQASITAKGAGFPLYAFNPRQVRGGVSVQIKGHRIIIPHAFIATMPNGHVGVFARGAYGGKGVTKLTGAGFGRFLFGRARLPINELYTLSPPDALSNDDVISAMQDRVDSQASAVIAQEVNYAAR